jgi:hypothetical protein
MAGGVCTLHISLPRVDVAYIELYGKSIEDQVQSETGGLLRQLLLEIIAVAM